MSLRKPLVRRHLLLAPFLAVLSVFYLGSSSSAEQVKDLTAEQVAETAIAMAGNGFGRAVLSQIRRNGLEIGKETRTRPDGKSEECRYEPRLFFTPETATDTEQQQ